MAPISFSRGFLFLWCVPFLGYFAFQLLTASLPPLYALALGANEAAIGLLTGVIALSSLVSPLDRLVVGPGRRALGHAGDRNLLYLASWCPRACRIARGHPRVASS